jgi:hypothetical protein
LELGAKSFYPPGWADDAVRINTIINNFFKVPEDAYSSNENLLR